jgi:hypothetical protein
MHHKIHHARAETQTGLTGRPCSSRTKTYRDVATRYYQSLRSNGLSSAEAAAKARQFYLRLAHRHKPDTPLGQPKALEQHRGTQPRQLRRGKGILIAYLGIAALVLAPLAVSSLLVRTLSERVVAPLSLSIASSQSSPTAISRREHSTGQGALDFANLFPISSEPTPPPPSPNRQRTATSNQGVDWRQADRYYFYFTLSEDRRESLENVLQRLARYFGTDCGVDNNDPQAVARFIDRIKRSNPSLSTSGRLPSVIKVPILNPISYTDRPASSSSSARSQVDQSTEGDLGDQAFSFSLSAQGGSAIQHNIRTFFENQGQSWRLLSGERASVNAHFGPYSTDQGMVMGAENVGDGVCNAVSMLLYRAAESGLEVDASHWGHEYAIHGVPPEYWVTIYGVAKDAWVRNPLEHPVEIRWHINGDTITIGVKVETPPAPVPGESVAQNLGDQGLGSADGVAQVQGYSEWFEFLRTFLQTGDLPNLEKNVAYVVDAGPYKLSLTPINVGISPVLKGVLETVMGEKILIDEVNFWIGEGLPSNQLLELVQPQAYGYHDILVAHEDNIYGFPLAAVGWWGPGTGREAGLLLHGAYHNDGTFSVSYLDTAGLPIPEILIPKQFRNLRAQFVLIFVQLDEDGRITRTYR